MPRRLPRPDHAAVLATLPANQRAVVREWEESLGLPPGGWVALPGLPDLLLLVAGMRLAVGMPELSRGDAFSEGLEWLGISDDSELGTRPADSLLRKLRRWVQDAHGIADEVVRARAPGKSEIPAMTSDRITE